MFSSLFRSPQPAPASVSSATASATSPAGSGSSPTLTSTTDSRSSSARPSASSPGLPPTTAPSSVSSPHAHPFAHGPHGPHGTHGFLPVAPPGTRSSTAGSAAPPAPSTQRQIDEARNAVVASIGNMVDRELSGRAAQLHANNAAIERQERDVARALDGLRRDNDKLARLAAEHTRKVKEIGNVQNWAEMLEREFLIIEETLRLVKEGSDADTASDWSGSECPEGCDCGRPTENGKTGLDPDGDLVMAGEVDIDVKGEEITDGVIAPEMVPIPESP